MCCFLVTSNFLASFGARNKKSSINRRQGTKIIRNTATNTLQNDLFASHLMSCWISHTKALGHKPARTATGQVLLALGCRQTRMSGFQEAKSLWQAHGALVNPMLVEDKYLSFPRLYR
eukprot:m.35716 g.35716  ORF g.35716 m.35716 type:complete len:118 (+) comp8932_c0_seq2:1146-1499(+)